MVVAGSVQRAEDNPLNVEFAITDFQSTVPVTYQGILPDLFAENSGVVATGKMQGDTLSLEKSWLSMMKITCRQKWPNR